MRRVASDAFVTIICLLIVTFLSVYGGNTGFVGTLTGAVRLVRQTLRGKNLTANFWGVTVTGIINSFQLIIISAIFTLVLAAILIILSIMLRRRFGRYLLDWIVTFFESIPDTMFVVIFAILSLVLFERFDIDISVFSDSLTPSLWQTTAPAIALCIPAAFYIRRILILRFEDEINGLYVLTAKSKGNSVAGILFKHVFPNLGSTFLKLIPSSVAIILSSIIFCTAFFEYRDLFYKFGQAVGWQNSGQELSGHFMGFVPAYQPGTVWLIGLLLVGVWALSKLVFKSINKAAFPREYQVTSSFVWIPVRKLWITVGTVILLLLFLFGTFPHLLTPFTPAHIDFGPPGQPWPLPMSRLHPFGTDDIGRDLLSLMLYGTWPTLLPAFGVALLVTFGSLIVAAFGAFMETNILRTSIHFISRIFSILPVFYVLFLILYPRNQPISRGHTSPIWQQDFVYFLVLIVIEIGRSSSAFYDAISEWREFSFMDGVESIGKTNIRALFTSLQPWLLRYSLTFMFGELSRILSLITQLAAFSIFMSERWGYLQFNYGVPPLKGILSAQANWFSTVGAVMNQFAFVSYPYVLYWPILFILLAMIGANFISRGIRGGRM